MKFWDVEQGSDEWLALRRGIPTASNFDKLMTPTGRPSKQMDKYIYRCIAEMTDTGDDPEQSVSEWMTRGLELEAEAADWYELQSGYELRTVGFVTDDQRRWGCSPDRLIYDNGELVGGLEIKCPAPWTFLADVLRDKIDPKYRPQVEGQMLIAELPFVVWLTYHPRYGGYPITVWPQHQSTLGAMLVEFHERKMEYNDLLNCRLSGGVNA